MPVGASPQSQVLPGKMSLSQNPRICVGEICTSGVKTPPSGLSISPVSMVARVTGAEKVNVVLLTSVVVALTTVISVGPPLDGRTFYDHVRGEPTVRLQRGRLDKHNAASRTSSEWKGESLRRSGTT